MFKHLVINHLERIEQKLEQIMSVAKDIKALVAAIDKATNDIAARIALLLQKVGNSMSDVEVTDVKAGLQAEIDRLTVLGQDPADPVPTP